MAQTYDPAFTDTRHSISDSKVRPHLWYKERLRTKILKESKGKHFICDSLNGRNWRFLKNGVDDFRDGFPPVLLDGLFIQDSKGPRPVLCNAPKSFKPVQQTVQNRFTKDQLCFSKVTPLKQARKEYIAEIEYGLTQHPLALYPHLEEGMPPELFEEVVDVLDPEMHLNGDLVPVLETADGEQDIIEHPFRKAEVQEDIQTKESSTRPSAISSESKHKNPYQWLPKKEESGKEDKKSKLKRPTSPSLDENIKQVTKEFCDWVASLGGEQQNIEESTIMGLFASGYQTKPTLTVPIQVVELSNVPVELRMSVGASTPLTATRAPHLKEQRHKLESNYYPSWVKIRYGAWYLNPKTWKKQNADEPLKDPNPERGDNTMDSRTKLSQKDIELLQLHGTAAFKEFIEKRGCRRPNMTVDSRAAGQSEVRERDAFYPR